MSVLQRINPDWVEDIRPRPAWFRKILRGVVYILTNAIATMDVKGRENIPGSGAVILAGNHFTIYEPPMLIYTSPRPLNILAAGDLDWPLTQAWALALYGYIPTNRESFKPSTIREAVRVLRHGEVVGIFPEAGMNPELQLRKGKPGVAYLSALAEAPVLPVGFSGFDNREKYWRNLSRPTFKVRIGRMLPPCDLPRDSQQKKAEMEKYTEEVMRRIAALIPGDLRGPYRDDPLVERHVIYKDLG